MTYKLMRILGYTFAILILLNSCKNLKSKDCENNTSLISDSLKYEFINHFIKSERPEITGYILNQDWGFPNPYISHSDSSNLVKMDTLFTNRDISFIFEQLEYHQCFRVDSNLVSLKKVMSVDTLNKIPFNKANLLDFWSNYRKKFGNGGYYSFSLPLFNLKKDIVIFRVAYFCGTTCGYGGTFIYKKKNDNWIKIYSLDYWVS